MCERCGSLCSLTPGKERFREVWHAVVWNSLPRCGISCGLGATGSALPARYLLKHHMVARPANIPAHPAPPPPDPGGWHQSCQASCVPSPWKGAEGCSDTQQTQGTLARLLICFSPSPSVISHLFSHPLPCFSCVSTSFFPVCCHWFSLSFLLSWSFNFFTLLSLFFFFFKLSPKALNKQSKQKRINKTFQVDAKQAIPTEHFSYFHDSSACVCHLLFLFVSFAYLGTFSANFNGFALWVIPF